MKVVFDTNIFVSALVIPGGQAERALHHVVKGRDELLVSRAIISELVDVLGRKFARDAEELSRVALFVADLATLIEPFKPVMVLTDERDNNVLACALAGKADLVVTGDRQMLDVKEHEGTRIVTLRDYLALAGA